MILTQLERTVGRGLLLCSLVVGQIALFHSSAQGQFPKPPRPPFLPPLSTEDTSSEDTGAINPAAILSNLREKFEANSPAELSQLLEELPELPTLKTQVLDDLKKLVSEGSGPLETLLAARAALEIDPEAGSEFTDRAGALLASSDENLSRLAANALAFAGAPGIEKLKQFASEATQGDRSAAVEALGRTKNVEPDWFVSLLGDGDPSVQLAAANSLGQAESLSAEQLDELEKKLGSSDSVGLRSRLAFAVASKIENAQQWEALLQKIDAGSNQKANPEAAAVYRGIQKNSQRELFADALAKQLSTSSAKESAEIVDALTQMGTPGANALTRAVGDHDSQYWAVIGLGEMGSQAKDAIPALVQCLDTADMFIQAEVFFALAKIGVVNDSVEQAVARHLGSSSSSVQYAATFAAAKLDLTSDLISQAIGANTTTDDAVLKIISHAALAKNDPKHVFLAMKALKEANQSDSENLKSFAKSVVEAMKP